MAAGYARGGANAAPLSALQLTSADAGKRKRRPAGTPDPDAEVVSLSPRTLLETDRYVCDICNQGFQREQNLQMHRRRHKVPWKLLKKEDAAPEAAAAKKRVYVCPEESCLHHSPAHALGDLVGIKKHFRRKHSASRQWSCARCGKAYAVHSDFKAHLRTCGTRGHSCDCGRVFSRVEAFIDHQSTCADAGRSRDSTAEHLPLGRNVFLPAVPWRMPLPPPPPLRPTMFGCFARNSPPPVMPMPIPMPRVELQLLPLRNPAAVVPTFPGREFPDSDDSPELTLAIGTPATSASNVEMRRRAKREAEAEQELESAKRLRQRAWEELRSAHAARELAVRQANAALMQVTCLACRQKLHAEHAGDVGSYMSSVVTAADEQDELARL